jgi:hypothetical protein
MSAALLDTICCINHRDHFSAHIPCRSDLLTPGQIMHPSQIHEPQRLNGSFVNNHRGQQKSHIRTQQIGFSSRLYRYTLT